MNKNKNMYPRMKFAFLVFVFKIMRQVEIRKLEFKMGNKSEK